MPLNLCRRGIWRGRDASSVGAGGKPSGTILCESKRTKNWSDSWLAKLREDQRSAKAEIAVLGSQVLPKGIETFEMIDGVWVTHPRATLPVAAILRQTLPEIAIARQASEGQQTKMEMVYQYLTGPRFRQRARQRSQHAAPRDALSPRTSAGTARDALRSARLRTHRLSISLPRRSRFRANARRARRPPEVLRPTGTVSGNTR